MTAPLDEKEAVELKVTDGGSPELVVTPEIAEAAPETDAAPETPKTVDCTPPDEALPTFGDGVETIALITRDCYGDLYKVHNVQLNKDMCARLIPASKFHNEESRKSFLRFCRRYITITHPSMVPLYSFHEDAGGIWFMMDAIEGPSLETWMDNGEFKSSAKIADIFEQLIESIQALHKVGIRFGAMHPAGVFILDNGHGHTILLRDWWAYALLQAQQGQPHTDSMAYASPEQLEGDGKLDERADVYTYGAMLFEALTGHAPFSHPDPLKLAIKIMKDPAPKVDGQYEHSSFAQLAERCLSKDPADRYQSFEDVAIDLGSAARGAPLKSRDPNPESSAGSTRRLAIMVAISMMVLTWFAWFYMKTLGDMNSPAYQSSYSAPTDVAPPTIEQQDDDAYRSENDGKYEEALNHWTERAAQSPNDPFVLNNLGRVQIESHMHEAALLTLARSQSLDMSNGEASYQMGQLEESLGKPDAAIGYLNKALQIEPQNSDYLNALSFAYTSAGKFQDAVNASKEAIKIDPNSLEGQFNLGIAYYGAGQFKNALAAFDASLQQDETNAAIWTNLSLTYLKMGLHREAIAAATEATNLDPHDVRYAANLAHAYFLSGDLKKAEEMYNHALNLDRFDGATWAGLADVYDKTGRAAEAAAARKKIPD